MVEPGMKPLMIVLYIIGTLAACLSLYIVCHAINKRLGEIKDKRRVKRRERREKRRKMKEEK